MSGSSVQILAQAHAYIESGNLEDAENLIRSLLEQEPDNTDAWWLLAHSVRDSRAAREALFQVLRLDPNDQQARSLLSALDDRFPDEPAAGERSRLRLPRPRLSMPGIPFVSFPGDYGSYSTPVSYLVLIILLVVGGWLVLRYFGFQLELIPAVPAETATATVAVTETAAAETATAPAGATETAPTETATATETAPAETATGTAEATETAPTEAVQQQVAVPGESGDSGPAVSGDTAPGDSPGAGATPAPVTAAVIPPLPGAAPGPVPTYPFPIQTDPAEFARQYAAAFLQAGLQPAVDTPLVEGSQFGSTALASVCLQGSLNLRGTIDTAMEVMAGFAGQLENSAPALGVRIIDCDGDLSVLRVVAVPLETALEWSKGALDLPAFQGAWRAVG